MQCSEQFLYIKHTSYSDISQSDRDLIESARKAAEAAYSPYSRFSVGAALRLSSGEVVTAANIESEVYPQGMCAERTLLYFVGVNYPQQSIVSMAVISISSNGECYPCGACRQSILDAERRQQAAIRVVMAGANSATIVESASVLLPFAFELER